MNQAKLTVFFENPFWIGIYEREADGRYEVCKITFGSEPKDYEVNSFLLNNWNHFRFSPSLEIPKTVSRQLNPKRMQRDIRKQLQCTRIGTKAQQALKLQHEEGKQKHKIDSREQREAKKEYQFELHQTKRKEKHRGH
jgi:hypothetical protein